MEEGLKEQTAPVEAPVEEASQTADDTALNDVDAIAEAFENTSDPVEEPTEALEGAENENTIEDTGGDFPTPDGFSKDVWGTVPEQARAIIQQREEAHAKALSDEKARVSDSLAQTQHWAQNANEQLLSTLATLQQVTEAEFGGIDWNTLATSDPSQYIQLQQQYLNRVNAVKQIQDNVNQLAAQYRQRMAAEYQEQMNLEASRVLPKIKALMGSGYSDKEYVGQVVQYLRECGVPDEGINSLRHGYEAELVTKAMLYDRMQKARLSAQQKISEAPMVSTPKGASNADNEASARLAKAKAYLSKHNNDNEALASVFESL